MILCSLIFTNAAASEPPVSLTENTSATNAHTFDSPTTSSPKTKYLTNNDLANLDKSSSFEDLKARFGEPMKGDFPAASWPQLRYKGKLSDLNLWRRAYWFFFKRQNGRITRPLELQFVASLKDQPINIDQPLIDLVPYMTIDWPESDRGLLLIDKY